jgi:hypothetical protein
LTRPIKNTTKTLSNQAQALSWKVLMAKFLPHDEDHQDYGDGNDGNEKHHKNSFSRGLKG